MDADGNPTTLGAKVDSKIPTALPAGTKSKEAVTKKGESKTATKLDVEAPDEATAAVHGIAKKLVPIGLVIAAD